MTTLHPTLKNLPSSQADAIQTRFDGHLQKLISSGATLAYEDKNWNVKLLSQGDGVFIRAHAESNCIHGAFFRPSEVISGKTLQDRFEILPPESALVQKAFAAEDHANYPSEKLPYSMKILLEGELIDDLPSTRIAEATLDLAKEWFTGRGARTIILPMQAKRKVNNPSAKDPYKAERETLKLFFKGFFVLMAAYYIYKFTRSYLYFFRKIKALKSYAAPVPTRVDLSSP